MKTIKENNIIPLIRKQLKIYSDCMDSKNKWNSYNDRPFCDGVIRKFGWRRAKGILGLKCTKFNYTNKEIIDGIKMQFKKHPDCTHTTRKWNSYKDKPFGVSCITCHFGWEKAQEMTGAKCFRYFKNYSEQEILDSIKKQLKKRPDCMNSAKGWDRYKDKIFSSGCIIRNVGWHKAKEILGLKYLKQNHTKQEVISGVKKQYNRHSDCMDSGSQWDKHADKPFSSSCIIKNVGWKQMKNLLELRCNSYTEQEIIDGIKKQHKKHPDCLDSKNKWSVCNDRPFSVGTIINSMGWERAKKLVGVNYHRHNHIEQEVIDGMKKQLKKHPHCTISSPHWDLYKDKPFSSQVILRIGWIKCKVLLGLSLGMFLTIKVLGPLLIKNKDKFNGEWLADTFELLHCTISMSPFCHQVFYRSITEERMAKIIRQKNKYSEEDMKLAKKCFMNLVNKWRRKNIMSKAA